MELAKFRNLKPMQSSALVKIWTLESIRAYRLSKFELWNVNEVEKFWKPGAFVVARSFCPILGTTFVKTQSDEPKNSSAFVNISYAKSIQKGHLSSRIFARLGVSSLYVVRYFSKVANQGL